MERNTITPPKPCFALEQHVDNPLCRECPHKIECGEMMGHLAYRVDVDRVQFHFMPEAFVKQAKRTDSRDPDFDRVEALYRLCYLWVFDEKEESNVEIVKEVIYQQAVKAGTSIKMFLLANMLGWQQTHRDSKFYPTHLTADAAVKQVKNYAEVCRRKFGVFDTTALDRLMGSDIAKKDFETDILNSEIVFGSWVINYKLLRTGKLMDNFFREKEAAVNPHWLAIEPSYYNLILRPHQENPDAPLSDLLRRHRSNVLTTLAKLKKSKLKAMEVFSARERIMPEAVRFVLSQRGLRPEHFQMENAPVKDSAQFWGWLARAIQQYECLKFVYNLPSVFDRHFTRTDSVLS